MQRRGDDDAQSEADDESRLQLQRIFRTPQHSHTKRTATHSRNPSISMLLPSPMMMRSRSGGTAITNLSSAASGASSALDAEWSSADLVALSQRIHAAHSARHSMAVPSLDVAAAQARGLRPHEAVRALLQVDAYLAHYSAFVQSEIQRQPMGDEIAAMDFQLETADDAVVAAATALLDQAAAEKMAANFAQQQQQQQQLFRSSAANVTVALSPIKSSAQQLAPAGSLLSTRPGLAASSSQLLQPHPPVMPTTVLEVQHKRIVVPATASSVAERSRNRSSDAGANGSSSVNLSAESDAAAKHTTKSVTFSARVLQVLQRFFVLHSAHPFPTEDQREELARACDNSPQQVANWFDNARKRRWKPFCAKLEQARCALATQPTGQCVCAPATPMGRVPVHAWTDMFRQKLQAAVTPLPTAAHGIWPPQMHPPVSQTHVPQIAMQQFVARNQLAAAAAAAAASSLPPHLAASFLGMNPNFNSFASIPPHLVPLAPPLSVAAAARAVPAAVVAGSKRKHGATESKRDGSYDQDVGANAINQREEQTERDKRSKISASNSGAAVVPPPAISALSDGSAPRRPISVVLPKPPPIPARSLRILRAYFLAHIALPFPTEAHKLELVASCGMSLQQITHWFENARKRSWKPFCAQLQQAGCSLATNPMATCDCNQRAAAARGMLAAPGPPLHVWSDMFLGAAVQHPAAAPLAFVSGPARPPFPASAAARVQSTSAAAALPVPPSGAVASAAIEQDDNSSSDEDGSGADDRTRCSDNEEDANDAAPAAVAFPAVLTARRRHRAKSASGPAAASGASRSKFSLGAVASLRSYFLLHIGHPYPSERDRRALAVLAGDLEVSQVTDWFMRARKQHWKPYKQHLQKVGCAIVTQTGGSVPPVCSCRPDSASSVAVPGALSTGATVRAHLASAARADQFAPPHSWLKMWGAHP